MRSGCTRVDWEFIDEAIDVPPLLNGFDILIINPILSDPSLQFNDLSLFMNTEAYIEVVRFDDSVTIVKITKLRRATTYY